MMMKEGERAVVEGIAFVDSAQVEELEKLRSANAKQLTSRAVVTTSVTCGCGRSSVKSTKT